MTFGKRQSSGFGGVERRGGLREARDLSAQILLAHGKIIQCRVIELSTTGARLAVTSMFGIPDTFELRAAGRTYRVKVTRRAIRSVGVKFV
jgi:hypothetical protein